MNSKSLVSGSADSGAYTDLNRLSSLKHGDRDSEANVRKVAQEFESLFISEMLKASRKASDVLADDNPMNTETVKQYRDMYDQQLAVSMSREGGGIGLQDVLVRQLTKSKSTAGATSPFPRSEGSGPALWGNKAHLDTLFGSKATVAAESKSFVFRYRSPDHWVDVFRSYYGPVVKAFAAIDPGPRQAMEVDLRALLGKFNVAEDGTLVVPSEYLEVVITKK